MKSKKTFVLMMIVLFVVSFWICEPVFGEEIVAWGSNDYGECNVPPVDDFVAIVGGAHHSLAIHGDGSLAGWGYNNWGQCDVPDGNDFVAIAGGSQYSLALRSDGSLVAWGWTGYGACDVPSGNDFVAIASGQVHGLALKSDGSLAAWGSNGAGQCDVPEGKEYVAIAAGSSHCLALKSDGSLAAWGSNAYGQCNVPSGSDFVVIAAGGFDNLVLKSDGSLAGWGRNYYGQSDVPTDNDFVGIAAGDVYSLALKSDGSLAAWGNNTNGECNVPAGNDFVAIAAGDYHCLALVPPRSDHCSDAIPMKSNEPYNGTSTYATGADTSSCGYNDTLDVWHSFTPKFNYEYTISLCGSAFDTTLAVFDGCGGTELVCNDDAEPGACPNKWPSELTLPLLRDYTYFIRIAGYDRQTGDYTLTIHGPKCTGPIPGDLNNDCKISFVDFAIMASHWLECNLDPSEVCWQ